MFFRLFAKKGQSTAEYAILIGIVIAAAVGIQTYVKRGLQAQFKTRVDNFVIESSGDPTGVTLADSNTIGDMQFEEDDYMAKSSQVIRDSETQSNLYKEGNYQRLTTETQQLGNEGDYRVYDY